MPRHQQGYVFKSGGNWYGRWREDVLANGEVVRKQRAAQLAEVCDRYRTKADVRPLLEARLRPLNEGRTRPESTLTVVEYGEKFFLPRADRELKPSTASGYHVKWATYLKPALGSLVMRDARCVDITNLLADIHRKHGIGRMTLRYCKAIIRSLFTFAKQQGVIDGENPARDAAIPRDARASKPTHAYSPDEVLAMLAALDGVARTAISLMSFAGLRPGEARALRWADYNGKTRTIEVKASMWRTYLTRPKTEESCAPVPVAETLAKVLADAPRTSEFILAGPSGKPADLKNLARRVVVPALACCAMCGEPKEGHAAPHEFAPLPRWRGWYAFRRGSATLVTSLDTPLAAKSLLRHSNMATTQQYYIKSVSADARRAVALVDALCKATDATSN